MAPEPPAGGALSRLAPLLAPQSIAIVGASATPGKYGNTVLSYLRTAGFAGRIYPINPDGGVHDGLTFHRSLKDVPERVDCAFTVIPAAATPKVVREAADAGVRALIVAASGFAELGSLEGLERQNEIASTARAAGMILLGPNTNGIWNAHHALTLGYNTSHGEPMRNGPISVAAHSGALFDSFIPRLHRFGGGFAKLVPLGNEATLDMLDVLEALIEDPDTGVVGLVIEAIGDGARLRELSRRARTAGKPIIALKLGRSAAGATAAIAHATRLAGSFRAYEALLRDCGIPLVKSIETLAAVLSVVSDPRALRLAGDTRLIGVSGSGGGCSLMADHAAERGIALAGDGEGRWTGETARAIAELAGTGLVRNPIDGGNLHGYDKLPALVQAMERDRLGGPVAVFSHRLPTLRADMLVVAPLIERKQRAGAPVLVVSPGGLRPEMEARYAQAGVPVFSDLATCFDTLRALYDANEPADRTAWPLEAPLLDPARTARLRSIIETATSRVLTEIESADILRIAGVHIVESRRLKPGDDMRSAAAAIGYPVVVKAIVPGIAHKNDAGLVATGIRDAEALTRACEALLAAARAAGAAEGAIELLLQPQVEAHAELILGTTFEPGLGHFLLAGLGGIDAELRDTVCLMPIPQSLARIRAGLAASPLGPLLARIGEYGPSSLVEALAADLAALQRVVISAPDLVTSIDVNPMRVSPTAAIAVDALIVTRGPP